MSLRDAAWRALTGGPWTTTRVASAEFGPPPASRYAAQLAFYTDEELLCDGVRILADIRAGRDRSSASLASAVSR